MGQQETAREIWGDGSSIPSQSPFPSGSRMITISRMAQFYLCIAFHKDFLHSLWAMVQSVIPSLGY